MKLPKLRVLQSERQMVDAFRGYNHNLRIGDSEFYDMKNMTSDHYPVLSTRKSRGIHLETISTSGMIAKETLCYVEGSDFFIGTEGCVNMELSDGLKDLISMGAYVIIMPDKKWVNTIKNADGDYEWGSIDAEYESTGRIYLSMCDRDGVEFGNISEDQPTDPQNGELWFDLYDTGVLQKYSAANEKWVTVDTYIKIETEGIADNFNVGDTVKFSGMFYGDDTKMLYGCNKDEHYILVKGVHYTPEGEDGDSFGGPITVSRKMPDLDFITECNNRLWGCKYGTNEVGEVVNEIYASKLGDFKNWNCFEGVSTDSYRASCGSDGPFTGAITHLGCPLFFKENGLHKVYGDFPANFRIQYTPCRGVQNGCDKSLAIVVDTLFYKSRDAVCAYDGSLPVEVSSAFGDVRYSNAVAGAHGNKYYINMKDSGNVYHLFVYDVAKGMWHKEDNVRVDCFCSHLNELYAIDHDTKNIIAMFGGSDEEKDTEPVSWMVETGVWGMSSPDMKYISRLMIRMSLEEGASVEVNIQYDSSDLWEQVCVMSATSLRSFSIPVRPKRCDHFHIQIKGEGQCKIYSITKTVERGSDIS